MERGSQITADPDATALSQRLENWRRESAGGRRRLPEEMWRGAADVARQHGVWRTAKLLRLSATDLKRRVEVAGGGGASRIRAEPAFVEVAVPRGAASAGLVIELEGRKGARLTIRAGDARCLDVLALADVFFRKCR